MFAATSAAHVADPYLVQTYGDLGSHLYLYKKWEPHLGSLYTQWTETLKQVYTTDSNKVASFVHRPVISGESLSSVAHTKLFYVKPADIFENLGARGARQYWKAVQRGRPMKLEFAAVSPRMIAAGPGKDQMGQQQPPVVSLELDKADIEDAENLLRLLGRRRHDRFRAFPEELILSAFDNTGCAVADDESVWLIGEAATFLTVQIADALRAELENKRSELCSTEVLTIAKQQTK